MDNLTAKCFFEAIRSTIFQASQRSLDREELFGLSETLQLIMTDPPGDAAAREMAKRFCITVYASGLFEGSHCCENLQPLMSVAEQIGASLDCTSRTSRDARFPPSALCPSYPHEQVA